MTKKQIFFLLPVLIWELAILLIANLLSPTEDLVFQLAARYSARTSFYIIVVILLWTGFSGLKRIYSEESSRKNFLILILGLFINHLIHFVYLALNYHANELSLLQTGSIFGAMGYLLLAASPIYLWHKSTLSRSLYRIIYAFLFVLLIIFAQTYVGRLAGTQAFATPRFFFVANLALIAGLIVLNIYRILQDRKL